MHRMSTQIPLLFKPTGIVIDTGARALIIVYHCPAVAPVRLYYPDSCSITSANVPGCNNAFGWITVDRLHVPIILDLFEHVTPERTHDCGRE